jgi:hypothetical protein
MRWLGWSGAIIYFVLLALASFGAGPLGRRLSDATKKDERDSWNQAH